MKDTHTSPTPDALTPHDRAALELLIYAIRLQPGKGEEELVLAVNMLRKYIDDPTAKRFAMAKLAFDDIDSDIKKSIHHDADELAVKTASEMHARASLKHLATKLATPPPDAWSKLESKVEAEARIKKKFQTPLLSNLHRD
ncbi:MAG: hypothetical protein WCK65_04905 [Rhodospirillaceae bacterium]